MQCSEFESQLQDALDERRPPEDDSRLMDHAAVCSDCARVMRVQERLFRGLQLEPQADGPAAIPARVIAGAASASPSRNPSWLYLSAALVAVATTWLVVTGPQINRPPAAAHTTDTIAAAPAPVAAATAPAPRSEQTVSLATTDPEAYRWLLEELFEQIAAGAELESVDQITGGFRPLATTLNVALDTLWRTLPGTETTTSPDSDRPA